MRDARGCGPRDDRRGEPDDRAGDTDGRPAQNAPMTATSVIARLAPGPRRRTVLLVLAVAWVAVATGPAWSSRSPTPPLAPGADLGQLRLAEASRAPASTGLRLEAIGGLDDEAPGPSSPARKAPTTAPSGPSGEPSRPGPSSLAPGLRAEPVAGRAAGPDDPAGAPSGLEPGAVDRTSLDLAATYAVTATIGWASRSLAVTTRISITNRSGGPVDHVLLNTVAGPLGRLRGLSVEVGGRTVRATLDDQTIRVPFNGVLPDGGSVDVVVRYRATVRSDLAGPSHSAWQFTRTNGILDLYRWIPWLSRAHPFARPNHGDPFVTVVSPKVTLDLVADRPLRYAINARRVAVADGGRRQRFVAEQVRDVVLTAAADLRTLTGTVGRTRIVVATRPGGPAATMLRVARDAVRSFERLLGPYPYPTLVVAESAGGYGVEGPGIIWIPRGIETYRLRYLVSHEISHQWFYGLVGSDQATDPFADEAVADMVTRYVLGMRRAPRCTSGRLDLTIYDYSAACYYERIYIAGGNLLDDLRRRMGTATYFAALRTYLDAHRFGIGSTAELVATLDAATPIDVRSFLGRLLPRLRAGGP